MRQSGSVKAQFSFIFCDQTIEENRKYRKVQFPIISFYSNNASSYGAKIIKNVDSSQFSWESLIFVEIAKAAKYLGYLKRVLKDESDESDESPELSDDLVINVGHCHNIDSGARILNRF